MSWPLLTVAERGDVEAADHRLYDLGDGRGVDSELGGLVAVGHHARLGRPSRMLLSRSTIPLPARRRSISSVAY
jgi:hypothetical protein